MKKILSILLTLMFLKLIKSRFFLIPGLDEKFKSLS
jgi:hypothetical protein